jgi:hypothetical protein
MQKYLKKTMSIFSKREYDAYMLVTIISVNINVPQLSGFPIQNMIASLTLKHSDITGFTSFLMAS